MSRSADHNPRTTTYLWHVDLNRAYRNLEAEMLFTETKLMARHAAETRKAEASARAGDASHFSEVAGHDTPASIARRLSVLEVAILQTSETVMLLRYI